MSRIAIALDLGGTQLRVAAVDETGAIVRREAVSTQAQAGPDIVIEQMAELARRTIAAIPVAEIIGVGVCSPGPLDANEGVIMAIATISNFENVPIVKILEDKLKSTVRLANDAVAAAIGEWKFGSGQGLGNLVYITVSTGIGGGVISDGRVLRGRRGFAGHIGHMSIVANGKRCGCGCRGCWEAYASGTAFTDRARQKFGSEVRAAQVFELAAQGNETAQSLVDEQAEFLGIGIINMLHLYSPERVVLGGGVSNGFDQLLPGIQARIQSDAMLSFRGVEIVRASLGDNSGLLGVASLVFSN